MRRTASEGEGARLDRISTLLLLAIVLMVLLAFGNAFRRPYEEGLKMGRRVGVAQQHVDELRGENEALAAEVRYLATDRGVEVEARRQRYVRPWETPIRVVFRGNEPQTASAAGDSRAR